MKQNDLNIDYDAVRAVLLARKQELTALGEMSRESRSAVTLDQTSVGRVSRIDAIQAQQMALATDRKREVELAQIEAAMTRLDDGDYGYCVMCDEPIAAKRLALSPAVPTCIDCAR